MLLVLPMPTTSLGGDQREQATAPIRGRGFSLLELVLVIVVTATLGGIALPRMSASTGHARVEQGADRIEAFIDEACRIARATSKTAVVTIDTTEDTMELAAGARTIVLALGDAPYHADITAASFKGGKILTIDGMGVPNSGGTVTIASASSQRVITFATPPEAAARVPIVLK